MWERTLCTCRTELVWDGEHRATGLTPEGASATIGPGEAWHPEQLLAQAVDAATMIAFLDAAARFGLEVLGYVSSARVSHDTRDPDGVQLALAPCVVIADGARIAEARRLLEEAVARSPVGRSLRAAPCLEPEIVAASLTALA